MLFFILISILFAELLSAEDNPDKFRANIYSNAINLDKHISIYGTVKDEITKKGIKSSIKVLNLNEKQISKIVTSNPLLDGNYASGGLKPGQKVIVNIEAQGYFAEDFLVELPDSTNYIEISRDFTLKPMIAGTKIPLKIHPFDRNKLKMRFGTDFIFSRFLYLMKKYPNSKFEIEAYPDDEIDLIKNQRLTKNRCLEIRNYFEDHGIDFNRLEIKPNIHFDPMKMPLIGKAAKGKRYKGTIYFKIISL